MENRMRRVFASVYGRYILSFTLLVLLVIVAMGTYLYNYYYNTMRDDFVRSNEEYIATVATQHENNLALLGNTAVQVGLSDTMIPFRLEDKATKTLPVIKQLSRYLTISQFYHQVFLLYGVDEYLYSANTSVSVERFLDNGLVPGSDTSHTLYSLLRSPGTISALQEQPLAGMLAPQGSGVVYALSIQPSGIGSLTFVVGSSYYDTLLNTPEEDLRANYILADGHILVSRGEGDFLDTAIEEYLAINGAEAGFEIRHDGREYYVAVHRGENGFLYCTVQNMSVFQRKLLSGQWSILLFIVLLTIPAALAIVLMSRRLHKPVSAIRALFRNRGEDNEFAAIQSGILELVDQNQELEGIVQESAVIRKSEVIRGFVRHSFANRADMINEGAKAGLFLDKRFYRVILAGSGRSSEDEPALESFLSVFSNGLDVTGYGAELITHNQTLFVVFSDSADEIEAFVARLSEVGKNRCESFVIAVSQTHEDFGEISLAYLEADTAYDNRFLVDSSDVLYFTDVAVSKSSAPVPGMYIDALKNALRLGDAPAMDSVINEIFRYLRSSKQSLFSFRVLYNEIIHVLIHELDSSELDFNRIYDVFVLSRCLSIQDLDEMLRGVCATLMRGRKDGHVEDTGSKMRQAADYMRQNYGDSNLNMNALADHFSVSTAVLSVKFKELMGMSPSDYLTLLRIERAKELLWETNLATKEIAGAVGYVDAHGFMKRFKKYTGLTPAQFRANSI